MPEVLKSSVSAAHGCQAKQQSTPTWPKGDADWAEADVRDVIAFALSAIVEAEYATLYVMLARGNAAKLAASSS